MNNFAEAIISSIVEMDAVPIKDDWTIFAYLGDTKYHVHFFRDGLFQNIITASELDDICEATARWFNREMVTTLPPPVVVD